ncbi:MAG: hypothetical protein ABGZ35_08210 [Planctomycetaceae bacterium]|jgi:hypothetical protein
MLALADAGAPDTWMKRTAGYRWFIDNRLVAETEESRYVRDLRGEYPGSHFVTVHAVDDGWNRLSAQIPVRVDDR